MSPAKSAGPLLQRHSLKVESNSSRTSITNTSILLDFVQNNNEAKGVFQVFQIDGPLLSHNSSLSVAKPLKRMLKKYEITVLKPLSTFQH